MRKREQYASLFDLHRTEVWTLVTFPSGARMLATDPQPYLTKTGRGYKLPPRLWPHTTPRASRSGCSSPSPVPKTERKRRSKR
jgi:hypothetical protein